MHFMFTFTCKCPCAGTPVLSYNLKRMTMVSGQTVPEDVNTFYLDLLFFEFPQNGPTSQHHTVTN